jgi:hypothetical protein
MVCGSVRQGIDVVLYLNGGWENTSLLCEGIIMVNSF